MLVLQYRVIVLLVVGLLKLVKAGSAPSCPASAPLSCHNTTAITDTCCTEVQGQVLQVQFWDTDPATGPSESWTIHGLWPDYCDGSYTQYCDDAREYSNITCILEAYNRTDVLDFMKTYWKDEDGDDETFWEHEWDKHGTCYSTLNPDCYTDYTPQEEVVDFFNTTVSLFKTLSTYDYLAAADIYPSSTQTYSNDAIMAALRAARGVNATIECEDGQLYEVEYTFNVMGSVADGVFVPAEPIGEGNGCPATVSYLPKDLSTSPTASSVSCASPSSTA